MLRLTTCPTSSPDTIAPARLPSPPMVTTTNAAVPTLTPMAGCTPASGADSTPASAASATPRPNTSVSTGVRLMPSRRTIIGSRQPAREPWRHRELLGREPPDQPDALLEHHGQAEGEQQPLQRVLDVDPAQQRGLDEHTEDADEDRRDDQRAGKPERALHLVRRVGAEREERAVGEVDDADHAEDDRQAQRHQHVQRPQHESVQQELGEDGRRHRAALTPSAPAGTGSRPSESRSPPAAAPCPAPRR